MNYKYLLMVTTENNNKYYEMEQLDENYFLAKYGRVGRTPQTHKWPMRKWESTLKAKVRKGYVDVTETRMVDTNEDLATKIPSDSPTVQAIFEFILQATNESVVANYSTAVDKVTQQMVDDAQGYIDQLSMFAAHNDWKTFNKNLLKLFTVIPREMSYVPDHLLDTSKSGLLQTAQHIIDKEQDTLDSLKGQIVVSKVGTEDGQQDLFKTMGIAVGDITDDDEAFIKRNLGEISDKFVRGIRVRNVKTTTLFKAFVERADDKATTTLWHGSRNQNWISLLEKGLILNPNAIKTGSAFGHGLYFAPKAKKSLGYTSLDGSYWSNGNSTKGFMGLYEVHVGNPYVLYTGDSSLTYQYIRNRGCHSTYGQAGQRLLNDEIIVYREEQSDIRYLVELK